MLVEDEAADVVLPLDLVAAASRVVGEHAQARVVADQVEAEFGRPTVGRLVSQHEIARLGEPEPGRGLQTAGPVLLREVMLVDGAAPERTLAVCYALIVPDRLPSPVRAELESSAEPLDRLLSRHRVDWQTTLPPDEGFVAPFQVASGDFPWLDENGGSVELLREISIGGQPVAILVDELPLVPACLQQASA